MGKIWLAAGADKKMADFSNNGIVYINENVCYQKNSTLLNVWTI